MGQSVYINFDTENLRSARCRGITDLRNQKFTQFVVGDSIELDLYLTGSNGALNIQDYSEIRLGMGNLDARPESGSYVVGGTETLAYDHSAADLQTAVAAISSSNMTTELTGFVFKVQFDTVGSQTLPTIDNELLQPRSTVSVTRLVTGDATTKEVWLWRLFRDPLAFTNTFTNIADNGVRATLSLATAGLYELIEQANSVKTFFEVELTSTDGNVRTVLQASVSLNGEVIGHNFSGSVPSGGAMPAEATAFLQSFPDPEIVGDLTAGGLILPTGATDGYVLTTDANGVGTWQEAATPTITVATVAAMQVLIDAGEQAIGQLYYIEADSSIRRYEGGSLSIIINDYPQLNPEGYVTMTSVKTSNVSASVKHDGTDHTGGTDYATGICYSVDGGTPVYQAKAAGITAVLSIPHKQGAPINIAIWSASSASSGRKGNLTYIYLNSNQLTSVNGAGLTALTYLSLNDNQLTSVNGAGLTALTYLTITGNQLISFNGAGLTALTTLNLNVNQLTSLDVSGLTLLAELNCKANQLTSLDISELPSVIEIKCDNNQLTSLDVSGLTSPTLLTGLTCDYNQLTSLDVSGLTALNKLHCSVNQLTSLDISGLALVSFNCHTNQLTSLLATGVSLDPYAFAPAGIYSNNLTEAALIAFVDSLATSTSGTILYGSNPGSAAFETWLTTGDDKGYIWNNT